MSSPAIKRQRKRRRIDTDGDPEFQVAPMVDVLLVLMLFFMAITSTEVLKKDPNLTLADAKNAKKAENKDIKNQITINVGWDGFNNAASYSMDGKKYDTPADLTPVVAAMHAANENAIVLIRADRDVQYSNISDLMGACANAGISTVSFAVLIGGGSEKRAPEGASASN